MKILTIAFKNINSLRGEHSVSFDQLPLSEAGIFAITGPTGSGKSTLLDVITLALFNQIPRLKKKISKNELESIGGIITRHTKEAFASIEYQVGPKKYTSSWSISRGRKDQLRDYEMFIYDEHGKPLDLKKSEIPGHNEQIIGLSYNQFIQSIILSQGEFSKFIKAGKNERGLLLEKITGTDIYRKVSRTCYEKYKALKTEIAQEKQLMGEIQLLDEETLQKLKDEQTQIQQKKTSFDKELLSLQKLAQVKEELTKNLDLVEQHKVQLASVINQKEAGKIDDESLAKHEQLIPLIPDITKLEEAVKAKEIAERSLQAAKTELLSWEQKLQTALDKMSQLVRAEVNKENFTELMSQFETEIGNMDRDILNLRNQGASLRLDIKGNLANGKLGIDGDAHPGQALEKLKEIRSAIDQVIAKNPALAKEDTSTILDKLSQETEQIGILNDINQLLENEQKNKNQEQLLNEEKVKASKEQQANTALLKTNLALVKSLESEHLLLLKQKEDALKIANLETYRDKLVKGEACPLCGSLEHPYSEHLSEVDLSQQETQINKNTEQQKNEKIKLEELQKLAHQIEHKLTQYEKELANTKENCATISSEIKTLTRKLPNTIKLDPAAIANQLEKLDKQVADKKAIVAIKQQNDELTLVTKQFEKLANILDDYKTLDKERKSKYTGLDAKDACNEIQNEYVSAQTKIAGTDAGIVKDKDSIVQLDLTIKTLDESLKKPIEKLNYTNFKEAKKAILSEERVLQIKTKRESINKEIIELESKIEALTSRNKQLHILDTQQAVPLLQIQQNLTEKREELSALAKQEGAITQQLIGDAAQHKRHAAREKGIQKLNEQFEIWSHMNQMIGDSLGNKFANFAQGLTLKNLMVFANRRLQHLTDRYLLDPSSSGESLMVIDQYQGNIQRSVSTLSGGEVFILSLALALSLSDMASKNVSLESLFIDEGFGTLDQETLDIAMNTLEKLQSESQKTVGVISHVTALKERINVQIKMKKNAQGYSTIELQS